jgi:hypothetical protein
MRNGKPVLLPYHTARLVELLDIFDEVTFNDDNDMVARLKATFPLLGELVVSYYAAESHLRVYQDYNDRVVLSQVIDHPGSRMALLITVQALLNAAWKSATK